MNDFEILNLVIADKNIAKLLNKKDQSPGYWELVSEINSEGDGYKWEDFKPVLLFENLRAVAFFKDEKSHAMFLIFKDMSWTSNTNETGTLGD